MLEELTKSLRDLDFTIGSEYRVVTISIDSAETTSDAVQKKQDLLALYDRADAAVKDWHFLLAAPPVLTVLAQAAGLHYTYNGQSNEYVHPLGVLVLTPQGKIARYLYGLSIPVKDIRLALLDAAQGQIGTPVDRLALLCYHYDAMTGRYTSIVLDATRWIGVATMIVLSLFLGSLWRSEIIKARGR
jgi:protein SCO1/2